jgi:hypothetical protein
LSVFGGGNGFDMIVLDPAVSDDGAVEVAREKRLANRKFIHFRTQEERVKSRSLLKR